MIKPIIVRPSADKVFNRGRRLDNQYYLPCRSRAKGDRLKNEPANRRHLIRTWQNLHHYSSHSPIPVEKKWRAANARFDRQHFGSHRGTCRFLNTYTLHAWM